MTFLVLRYRDIGISLLFHHYIIYIIIFQNLLLLLYILYTLKTFLAIRKLTLAIILLLTTNLRQI